MNDLGWFGLGCAVFLSTALLEVAWVHCVAAVGELRAARAGMWSAILCAIGLVGLFSVTRASAWMSVPEVLGAGVGTAVAVERRRRR